MNGVLQRARLAWPPLIALTAVLVIAVVAIWPAPPLRDGAVVIASKLLSFQEQPNGSMRVMDAQTGRQAGLIPTVSSGFVPGVLHGISIIRTRFRVAHDQPYRVTEMSDGRVLLIDPPTRTEIDLESFGRLNAASFAAFLHGAEKEPQ